MTRDDLKWIVTMGIGITTGLAGAIKLFPWIPDYWQHVITLAGFIAGIVGAKLGNSPLPGDPTK